MFCFSKWVEIGKIANIFNDQLQKWVFKKKKKNPYWLVCYIQSRLVRNSPKFKDIVHPKWKLSSCTHPQVVPNLYEFLLLNTKEDILKNVCLPNLWWSPLTSIMFFFCLFFSYYGSQWSASTFWLPIFFETSFVFSRRNNGINVGLFLIQKLSDNFRLWIYILY